MRSAKMLSEFGQLSILGIAFGVRIQIQISFMKRRTKTHKDTDKLVTLGDEP
jgi:hypothetical protein